MRLCCTSRDWLRVFWHSLHGKSATGLFLFTSSSTSVYLPQRPSLPWIAVDQLSATPHRHASISSFMFVCLQHLLEVMGSQFDSRVGGHGSTPAEMGLRMSRHPMARRTGELDMHSRGVGQRSVVQSPDPGCKMHSQAEPRSRQKMDVLQRFLPLACTALKCQPGRGGGWPDAPVLRRH